MRRLNIAFYWSSLQFCFVALQSTYDSVQEEKEQLEEKLRTQQRNTSRLEQSVHSLGAEKERLQADLQGTRHKLADINSRYEAVKTERDNVRVGIFFKFFGHENFKDFRCWCFPLVLSSSSYTIRPQLGSEKAMQIA